MPDCPRPDALHSSGHEGRADHETGEKPATITTIIDLHEWGDTYWFPWERWQAAGFKHGDRVKVTLERI